MTEPPAWPTPPPMPTMTGRLRGAPPPPQRRSRDQQWLYTALPAFPLLLLVLRLWYLSRQDLQTMLLLVQNVSPLGLVGSLLITLVWVPPALVLIGRALGGLLAVSSPERGHTWLTAATGRTPGWVVLSSGLIAALTWQLRFLPMLVALLLAIVALEVRLRARERPGPHSLVTVVCVAVPLAATVLGLLLFGPPGLAALRVGESVTAFLLLAPVLALPLLTGPVPMAVARLVTHWVMVVALVALPVLVAVIFVRTPVLPAVAVELRVPDDGARSAGAARSPGTAGDAERVIVVRGQVIIVDDRSTALLEPGGKVRFVPNEDVVSQVLCPDAPAPPFSVITVAGWPVEETMLSWLAPSQRQAERDPRCQGRLITQEPG